MQELSPASSNRLHTPFEHRTSLFEGATDEIENTEAMQDLGNTTVAGLGPPQQIFTPRQGAGGRMRAAAENRGSFTHPPQNSFPY